MDLTDELNDSQNDLRANARLYSERLREIPGAERVQLAQFIVTRCYLVVVATPDFDSAYRIFSVLNSRGLDLVPTDILKAEIIGQVPEQDREAYTTKWEGAEEDLGREQFNDLFSHVRMVYRMAKPQSNLLKEFKEHVPVKDPTKFIDDILMPMTKAFGEIKEGRYESTQNAGDVNEYLKWLNKLEFSDWIPPALAFLRRHRQNPDRVKQFFADIERLSYAMLALKWGINDRIERFSQLTAWIQSDKNPIDSDSPIQLSANEQFLVYSELDGALYSTHSARAKSTILLRLDSLLSGGGASYDYPTVTIEHVLPQTPSAGSKWVEWFPDEKDRLVWVHRLGNLALLTRKKNSSASNFEFEIKKQSYFSKGGISPFVLTTQVLDKAQWTVKEVEARQKILMDRFVAHWRLEGRIAPAFGAAVSRSGSVVRKQVLQRFWAQLIERSRAVTPLFANRSATTAHWLSAGIGRAGFWLSLSLTRDWASVECGIRVSNAGDVNKTLFRSLQTQKAQIESTFGAALNWELLPGKISRRISKDTEGGWVTPESEWPDLQDRMIELVVRLDKALRGPIQALDV